MAIITEISRPLKVRYLLLLDYVTNYMFMVKYEAYMRTDKERLERLIAAFNLLGEKDQVYLEKLTSELAKIHKAAPETGRKEKVKERSDKRQ